MTASDSCASSLAALAVQNTTPSAASVSPSAIANGAAIEVGPDAGQRRPVRVDDEYGNAACRAAHELLEPGEREVGGAEVQLGVGVAGVVDDDHRVVGAGGADPVVVRDQRGARGVRVGAAQDDDVAGLEPAEVDQRRGEPVGVVLGIAQRRLVAIAAVVADDERVARDRGRGCGGDARDRDAGDDGGGERREPHRGTFTSVNRSVVQPGGGACSSCSNARTARRRTR